jgi:RNA polymerase sigma-70 factor, ECF subfamily
MCLVGGASPVGVALFAAIATRSAPELPRTLVELQRPLAAAVRKAVPAWLLPETEDLTQVALLRLDRALKREPDRPLTRAYLGRIAYTTVVDEIRKRRREREHVAPDVDSAERPTPAPGPERLAESRDAGEAITACLEAAPPRARDALTLYLLGHSVPEISRLLDHTRKTAENVVYRGLAALRGCVEAKGYRP